MSEVTPDPVFDRLARFSPDSTGLDPADVLFRAGRASARTPRGWKVAVVGLVISHVVTVLVLVRSNHPTAPTPEVAPTPVVVPLPAPRPESLPEPAPGPTSPPSPWSYGAMLGVTDLDQLPTPSPTAGLTPDGPPLTPLSFRGQVTE